ncbi:MAG: MarR family transcriptional regulator [Gemmatales bacterium]|nr:MAG: MarR family transcriptional regulator [Gemmatales bacterium]
MADKQASPPSSVEGKLVAAIERLSQALRTALGAAARAKGLSPLQTQVLTYLLASGDKPNPSEVAARFQITLPTLSDALASLEAKGLITRAGDSTDSRRRVLRLTAKGRRHAKLIASWTRAIEEQFVSWSEAEKGRLLDDLLRLIGQLQAVGLISVSRMCRTCVYFQPDRYKDPGQPHHCRLLGKPLRLIELRVDCPDYEPAPTS